ncbi:MAG TPA: BrnT family toxin [Allosphingosinicella sp.]|nr:BrnT family toxin [Allosphingosinicella sp.]
MKISFDPAKRAVNLVKHGLDLADAGEVLDGPCIDLLDDLREHGEERWVSTGLLRGAIVVCVWAERGEDEARIISLRKASTNEQRDYIQEYFG